MWCIPDITPEFIARMEDLIALYFQPYDPLEPVLNFDETPKQLLADSRKTVYGGTRKRDYEYVRHGTRNIFLAVEAKAGFRTVCATRRRTKKDFAREIKRIVNLRRYRRARKIHIVLDNLNTHFEKSFYETFSKTEADGMLQRIKLHYTPKHASWLNMAEIEISILVRQCLKGRFGTEKILKRELKAWKKYRNDKRAIINWKFTIKDAQEVFKESYRTNLIE